MGNETNKKPDWLADRVAYIRGLKSPSDQQKLLIMIYDKPQKTSVDEKKLDALIRAERAADRAIKARAVATKVVQAEITAKRKARTHELCKAAGLMGLAGLVDKTTGKPTRDRGELLGALLDLAKVNDVDRLATWKQAGDALLAQQSNEEDKNA